MLVRVQSQLFSYFALLAEDHDPLVALALLLSDFRGEDANIHCDVGVFCCGRHGVAHLASPCNREI